MWYNFLSVTASTSCQVEAEICVRLHGIFSQRPFFFRPPMNPHWTGSRVLFYRFTLTVPLWTCPVCMKWNVHVQKKKKPKTTQKKALFDLIQSMICRICFLVVFSDYLKNKLYLFQVLRIKQKNHAWITFYHKTTKMEPIVFLRKELLEWLDPSLPDLWLDCLSQSFRLYLQVLYHYKSWNKKVWLWN